MRCFGLTLLSMMAVAMTVGCGESGPALLPAQGTVTLDGKPVPNALVTFAPKDGTGSPSNGVTDAAGNYKLRFNRDRYGVLPGAHNVTVEVEKVNPEDIPEGEPVPEFVPIPKKYSRPGELTADVSNDKKQYDFALVSK